MLTWSDLRTKYTDFTGLNTAANITIGEALMNEAHHELVKAGNVNLVEYTDDYTTTASDYTYPLLPKYGDMKEVQYIDGTNETPLMEVESWEEWHVKRAMQVGDGTPSHFWVVKGTTGNSQQELWVWPTPSASAKRLRAVYTKRVPLLSVVDYTTGTATFTNASATVTGAGTAWTAAMVGRAIEAPDGYWYDITAFASTTSITIATAFAGTTTAGATYTIGEIPLIEEAYQSALYYYAVGHYWGKERQYEDSKWWLDRYEVQKARIVSDGQNRTRSQVIREEGAERVRSRNLYPVGPL